MRAVANKSANMSKPYDVSLKVLVETHLPDWLALVPRKPRGPMRLIDSDLATVTAAADKVLLIEDAVPWILHLELQSKRDPSLEWRVPWYNALLEYKHKCLVHSLVVLLTKQAATPGLTGEWQRAFGGEAPYRYLRYQVIRAWELHADELARGPWGMFPLAPLCDDAAANPEELTEQMGRRLANEHPDVAEARELGTAMGILLGLRYSKEVTKLMMERVNHMIDLQESYGYQIIHEKGKAVGKVEGALETLHEMIMHLGKIKFGRPSAKVMRDLNAITDAGRLRKLSERILDVESWKELLS
jgi:predicted transposase YdaD